MANGLGRCLEFAKYTFHSPDLRIYFIFKFPRGHEDCAVFCFEIANLGGSHL